MTSIIFEREAPVLINSFSLIILIIFLFSVQHRHHKSGSDQSRLFRHMVIANIFLLLMDAGTFLVAGYTQPVMRTLQVIFTTLFYMLDPLPSYYFIRFADVSLNINKEKQERLKRWYAIPVLLHIVIAALTPLTGWYFHIDALNLYHRGPLQPLSFILSFILMIIAAVKVLCRYMGAGSKNAEIARNVTQYGWLLWFTTIPLMGGLLQIFDNSVTYVWNSTVIALLLLFINNQNDKITTDSLTCLYNRRQAFPYYERFVRDREKGNYTIAVVVIDINSFKSINDQYGHIAGDEALISVARGLEAEFSWDDFICRFGGDEYVVITKHGKKADLDATIDRLNSNLAKLYHDEQLAFELSVSAGYAVLGKKEQTLDQLFQKADEMMYRQKAKLMRRASDRKKR